MFIDKKWSIHFGKKETKSIFFQRQEVQEKLIYPLWAIPLTNTKLVEYLGCQPDSKLSGEAMASKPKIPVSTKPMPSYNSCISKAGTKLLLIKNYYVTR